MRIALVFLVLAGSVVVADAEILATARPAADSLDNDVSRPAPDSAPRAQQLSAPATERSSAGNPLWAIPLKVLSATRERPIFAPSRRPPPAVADPPIVPAAARAPKPSELERPQLMLVGTVVGEKEAIGVFLDQTTKNAVRLRIGEEHHGWLLQSVHGREATFLKDQQTTVLTLPQPGADHGAASPPPSEREPRRRGH
jgi:hypothetical protein